MRVLLQGGLGNQMFQYAAAYAIAKRLGCGLELDLSMFDVFGTRAWCRSFALDIFALSENTIYTHNHHLSVRALPRVSSFCRSHNHNRLGKYVFAIDNHNEMVAVADKNILFGYFANNRIFMDCRDELLKEFSFKDQPNAANAALLQEMSSCESVAIHIRRGDYMSEAYKNIFFHPSVQWYRDAMCEITRRIKQPLFYFFSDDIAWVKEQFADVKNAVFVDINYGADSYNDMRLMSICKHNIIANSTFSWWGAWLNPNPNKIVIAPGKYYTREDLKETYLAQMIPSGWMTI